MNGEATDQYHNDAGESQLPKTVEVLSAKTRLRNLIRLELESWSPEDVHEAGVQAAVQLRRLRRLWKECEVVVGFAAYGSEIDTAPLLQAAIDDGKTLVLPRLRDGELSFHRVENLDYPRDVHPYGMHEPAATLAGFDPVATAAGGTRVLVVCPGLAFDRRGGRLGQGKGYYDRFIAALRHAARVPRPIVDDTQWRPIVTDVAAAEVTGTDFGGDKQGELSSDASHEVGSAQSSAFVPAHDRAHERPSGTFEASAEPRWNTVVVCGYCHASQLVWRVPMDERDERVDLVVTDERVVFLQV